MQILHEGMMVKCDQCNHKMTSKAVLKSHLRSMHGLEKLQCDLCDFKSISRHSIWAHKKRIHDGEKYDCNLCDFTTNGSVTRIRYHVKRMHSSMRDLQCDDCEYKASVNANLTPASQTSRNVFTLWGAWFKIRIRNRAKIAPRQQTQGNQIQMRTMWLHGNDERKSEDPRASNAREHQISLWWKMQLHCKYTKKLDVALTKV